MFKRCFAVLLSIVLLAQLFVLPVSAEDEVTIYTYDNFDSLSEGEVSSLTNLWVYPKGNKINAVKKFDGMGTSLQFVTVAGSEGGPYIQTKSASLYGDYIVEGTYLLEDYSKCTPYIMMGRNPDGKDMHFFRVNAAGQVIDAEGEVVLKSLSEGEPVKLSAAVHVEDREYDIYVNGRKVKRGVKISQNSAALNSVRIQIAAITSGCQTKLYVDDFAVYSTAGGQPLKSGELSALSSAGGTENMNDGFFYVMDTPRMLRRGFVVEFEEGNDSLTPVMVEGKPYIPLRYSAEMLYSVVEWNASENTATVTYKGKTLTAVPGKNAEYVGESLVVDAAELAEFLGLSLWFEENAGILFLSERKADYKYNNSKDFELLTAMTSELIYDRPSGEQIVADVKETHPNQGHPRILFDQEGLDEILNNVKTNDYVAKHAQKVIDIADDYVNRVTEPTEYIIYSNRLLAAAREVLKRSRNLGLAYLITKDEAYAERLWTEINHCCTVWQDWHNYHFLDTGETTMAVAMAYDWLYDYWTPEQRKIMETAIVERALEAIMEDYLEIPGRDRANTPPGWVNYKNNWNLVCGGGVSAGALAILDSDPEYAELCGNVLEHMLVDIEESLENYAPDGGYVEGASYWNYAGIYLAYLTQNLMTAAGDDYGIMRTPGLDTTAYFNLDMASSGGVFNFSDCGTYDLVDPAAYWYSNAYRDPVLQATIRSVEEGQTSDDGLSVHRVLFYDPKLEADVGVKLPLNAKYDNAGVVTMRDNRELSDNYLIGFRSGDNSADHHHQDGGTFIIDMNGVRFAKDFGAGTYNEAGTYHRYRYSAQGHNTWVINPDMTSFSQVDKARAHIDKYEANDYEGYAISDLSNLYRGKIDSIRRGVRALEGKKVFVVEDELKSANPVEAYWQMHTTADIQILEGGKQAVMTIGEDQMVATLLTDNDAVFETHAAEPYEGTPNYPVSDSQADTTKLIIHLTNVTDERVAVEFRHIYKGEEIPTKHVEVEPLDAWSLNDGTYEEDPKLTDLKINGETVDGFASGKRNYKASVKWEELDALKVTADGDEDGEVTVRYPKNYPGTILAKVTKGEQSTTYAIKVDVIYDLSVWNDSKRLEIKGLSASDEPQPENCKENVLDGDYNTRWSAKDRNWIDFDLGKAKQVDYITLAFMSGDQRIAYLEVATSDDGIEWTTRYSGQSSGKTLDDEKFPVGAKSARYVRVVVAGTSVSRVGWNSVTEFKAFGK